MDKRSKVSRWSRLRLLVKAIAAQFKGVLSLQLAGKTYTPAELAQVFQDELDAIGRVTQTYNDHRKAVQEERAVKQRNHKLHLALESYVRGVHGPTNVAVMAFGLEPARKPKKTAAVKVEAVEKAKATRKERRTMGRKQRKAIKG